MFVYIYMYVSLSAHLFLYKVLKANLGCAWNKQNINSKEGIGTDIEVYKALLESGYFSSGDKGLFQSVDDMVGKGTIDV